MFVDIDPRSKKICTKCYHHPNMITRYNKIIL